MQQVFRRGESPKVKRYPIRLIHRAHGGGDQTKMVGHAIRGWEVAESPSSTSISGNILNSFRNSRRISKQMRASSSSSLKLSRSRSVRTDLPTLPESIRSQDTSSVSD